MVPSILDDSGVAVARSLSVSRRLVLLACGALAIALCSAQVDALTPGEHAELVYKGALAEFEAGNVSKAATGFEQAFALAPLHRYAWNAARLWERRGDFERAWRMYLRAASAAADSKERAKDAEAIGACEAQMLRRGLVRVLLVIMPDSAQVEVDGEASDPLDGQRVRWLKTGLHRLTASAPGYPLFQESFDVIPAREVRVVRTMVSGVEPAKPRTETRPGPEIKPGPDGKVAGTPPKTADPGKASPRAVSPPSADLVRRAAPASAPLHRDRIVAISVASAGGVALVTAGIVWTIAQVRLGELDTRAAATASLPSGQTFHTGLTESDATNGLEGVNQLRTTAAVLGGVGLIAAGTGAYLLVRAFREPASVTVVPAGPTGPGATLSVRW